MPTKNRKNQQISDKTWESLLKISEEAHNTQNIHEFVAKIHGILSELVSASNFFICLYDESSNKYFFPYFVDEYDTLKTPGVSYIYNEKLNITLYDCSKSVTDYVRRSGKTLRLPSEIIFRLEKAGEIEVIGTPSLSWLGVPLMLFGKTLGVMVVQSYDIENAYSERDEELFLFISDHIARAIENVRAEEEIKKQHELVIRQKEQILTQKEEIETQRDEIEAQRDLVVKQKEQIEKTYNEISASIEYATRLQNSILPNSDLLKEYFAENFVFFRPKQKVSGDFYWWSEVKNQIIVGVADCTGHGVPGAFMSMLGISLLREIVNKDHNIGPGIILRLLRKEVIRSLDQKGAQDEQKDGMDVVLISINIDTLKCEYAGANNPMYLIRDKNLNEYKPDKMPISYHHQMGRFTTHEIQLQPGDQIYMFSDGFVDQFGGKDRKKYKAAKFKELLLSGSQESMEKQKQLIEETFDSWKGDYEQIDDVCVVGVKI